MVSAQRWKNTLRRVERLKVEVFEEDENGEKVLTQAVEGEQVDTSETDIESDDEDSTLNNDDTVE